MIKIIIACNTKKSIASYEWCLPYNIDKTLAHIK